MLALLGLAVCSVPLVPGRARAAVTVNACGTISTNTVWTAGNLYVISNCSTVVATGVTLTVQPGTVVKFGGAGAVLVVDGTLMAQGTAGAPIAFTSLRDDSRGGDTNGDGASAGQAGDWSGVRFRAGSHGRLAYVFVGFGGSGGYDYGGRYGAAELESFSSDVTLDHVTLRASGNSGLYCDNASVQVTYGQVNDNAAYGLYWNGVDASVPLVVSDTTFSGNGAAGWLHFRDAPGTVTLQRNTATGAKNGFRADGRLNHGSLLWDNASNLPLLISPGMQVAPATTLTLMPGSVVKLSGGSTTLDIQGTLQSQGTLALPVTFTSVNDDTHAGDTNGDGASTGAPGQWASVRFETGSQGRVVYTSFEYGGSGAYDYAGRYGQAAVESFSSDVTLDHVTLRASAKSGLYCDNASARVSFGQVSDNGAYGLWWNGVDASVPLVVSDTSFSGNGIAAGWLHFRDAAGTVTFERNAAAAPKNGFRADGRLNNGSLTWNNGDDLPLLISGGLTIAPATTLALEPGTVVKFGNGSDVLVIQGVLDAQGTAGAPLALTSVSDDAHGGDTNGDGVSQGQPGQWSGLRFAAGSTGRVAYAFIGYGGSGAYDYAGRYGHGMVESFSSQVTFDHCTLYASGRDGLYTESATVAFTNGTVSDNAWYGLNYNGLDPAVPLVVTGNVFSGSQGSAARLNLHGNPPQITFQGNTGSGGFHRGFSLTGTLTSNVVWDNTGSLPLIIEGGLTVAAGATLTVQPGTVVKFAAADDVLFIQGALVATGTAVAPIAFTSLRDDGHGGDTNGDGASVGAGGDWSGLRFAAGSTGQLAYSFLGFGGSGAYDHAGRYGHGMVESFSSDVTFDHCTLHASGRDGLYIESATVAFTNSTVSDNAWNGLYYEGIDPATPLVIRSNTFSGNGAYGAWVHVLESAAQMTVEHNQAVAPRNGLRMSGGLTQGTVRWDSPNAPMVVDGGLAIRAGATLSVEPGTVVKFAAGNDVLQIQGTLVAGGTFAAPIAFTSIADDAHGGDTNGDGPSTGGRGQWAGLRFLSGSNVALRHSFIGYGGSGAYDHLGVYGRGLIDIRGGNIDIKDGTVRGSALHGVYTENADVKITYAAITDHAQNGIYNATPNVGVNARYNWWGDPSGPSHPTLNPTGTGSTVSNGVVFEPWLNRFTWLDPTTIFVHGVEALSWTAFDIDPATLTSDADATGSIGTQNLGRGFPAGGEVEWDTRPLPNGRYELRASWRDLTATPVSEAVRSVIANNDPTIIWHGGEITGSETWDAAHIHVVEDDVIVVAGAGLTIQPGTVVKFAPGTRIIVEDGGIIDAPATEAKPIILTSITDDVSGDTNLDTTQSLPRPGDWNGIVTRGTGEFNDNPFVDIRYTQSEHSGKLSTDERWLGSLVHHVTGDVTVPSGVTLTIEAGAVVKFDADNGLIVEAGGHLVAVGSVAEPIVFTSSRDDTAGGDTNGDSDATAPQPGDWRSIYVAGAEATFDHVEMRYASGSYSDPGMIRTTSGATVSVANSIIRDGFYECISAWSGATVDVTSSVIAGCDRGVTSDGAAVVHIINSTIDGNRIGLWGHSGRIEVSNTVISNSHDAGIDNVLSSPLTLRYSDVWSAHGSNYVRTADQTGSNGNISHDPHYVDREHQDYRLDYRSPAIDAADGSVAPTTDIIGSPRYDDPRTPNTGIATAGGAYADMGAYEFVETANSNLDLIVSNVSGPTAVMAGNTARVQWTVTNIGSGEVVGPWHDTVNLVLSPDANPTVIFAAGVLVGEGAQLGPGQSLSTSAEIRVPGSVVGTHYWQVVTNTRGEVFEGRNRENNTGLSLSPVNVDLPELIIGGPALSRQFNAVGEAHWFKFIPAAGQDVMVRLDRAGTGGATELYVGQGYMPTRERFDARHAELNVPDVSALAASTAAQTYYVLAYPASLPSGAAASFTISARALDFSLDAVGPQQLGNAGTVTLALHGGQLRSDMTFEIIDAHGGVHSAESVFISNSSLAYVTFDLTGLPLGTYSVRVRDGARTATLTNGINIITGTPGSVEAHLTMPRAMRPDWTEAVTVDYANVGNTDVVAPLMVLSVDNAKLRLPGKTEFAYPTVQLLGIGSEGPAGILPPGAHGTITLQMQPTASGGTIDGKLWVLSDANQPWDWNAAKSIMRPSFVPTDAWDAVFANFTASVASTVGQYQSVLATDATYLSQLGEYTPDVQQLLAFELNQAGLNDLTQRYALGAFGRGVSGWWELTVREDADGMAAVGAGSRLRFFRRQADGSYRGVGREKATLSAVTGGYQLREVDGSVLAFRADGRLNYLEDRNGNRVTAIYNGGTLTTLQFSDGDAVVLHYNANGRIDQVTDPVGRVTTYSYDPQGQHLLSVTDPQGTTTFSYAAALTPATTHLLQSVGFPGGMHLFASHDSQGRLVRIDDGDVEAVDYAYDAPSSVVATHATGDNERVLVNDAGQMAGLTDGLSRPTRLSYDARYNLKRLVGPAGETFSFGYDDQDRPISVVDPSGASNRLAYEPLFDFVSAVTDARGNVVNYSYDAKGNRTAIAYPGGADERWEYDAGGRITSWTNGRGQRVRYTYDGHGLLVRQEVEGGSDRQFSYDAHRNLAAVTDARGTAAMEYDAADRLTKITYPSGRYLRFIYDAAGRRIRSEDQDGFRVNYAYDTTGRLDTLTDAGNALLVRYSYDAAGRIERKDLGNGGTATYTYDGAGQVLSIVNRGKNNSVLSRFDYTYDAAGLCTTMRTVDGQWTYTYDPSGQLTHAIFASTNAGIANQDLTYVYDAAGNRVQAVQNGAGTPYAVNALNQYTSVGTSAYAYDADGNLIARGAGATQWTYAYDAENQLVAASGPSGSWTYEYDAFGNRVAATHDGQRTEYLVDPVGVGDVVGTYDAAGDPIARYVHGTGLVGRVDAGGGVAYYDFDALGNVAELAAPNGAVLNRYAYLPFGERLAGQESVDNPFQYVGQHGVMHDGNGLAFMRSRYFDAATGRFTQRDKAGLTGGVNLYAYVRNNPANGIDPSGLLQELLLEYILNPTSPEAIYRRELLEAIVTLTEKFNVLAEYVGYGLRRGYIRATGLYSTAELEAMVAATKAEITALEAQTWGAALSRWGSRAGNAARTVGRGILSAAERHPLVAAAVVGVTIGTLARNIEGVDEAAQMTLVDLNDWLGGWLLWTPRAAELGTPIVSSHDPNDLIGPGGNGASHWIAPDQTLPYTIRFENDKQATAPAQVVLITEQLDRNLDLTTFQLGDFSFDGVVVTVPPGRTFYSERLDLRASYGLYLDISGNLDFDTRIVTWELASVDPVTGMTPRDPLTGFLPPNIISPIGQGYVTYTIRPRSSSSIGTPISAEARIVFDTNDPIDTPQVRNPVGPIADCTGDCNTSGQVTVDELLTLVNIALGNVQVPACAAGDQNADGAVTIDEILTAVNYALSGCPAASAGVQAQYVERAPSRALGVTPTPTATATPTPSATPTESRPLM